MSDEPAGYRTLGGLDLPLTGSPDRLQELGWSPDTIGQAGAAPYTRGVHSTMYTGRRWTMRQYAGFSSAEETNERFRLLLERGQKGLSVAFDLPTQLGLDSDSPLAAGEVGKVGVAIDTVDDMAQLLAGIPLDEVSISMTINAPAAPLLAMVVAVTESQGLSSEVLRGTVQNDILKEYIARGTHIFPPAPSLRLITDLMRWCAGSAPRWNTISISGYHIREAGSTAVEELAFTLSNALAYVQAAVDSGLDVDTFAPRLSFFFNCHNDLFEEVAKFRAARALWYELMTERFAPADPKSTMLRFHTQVAGVSLTAQQPLNNIARVTVQALAAVMGGTQSLHTNSYDEALGLPTEASATIALRTQQIIAEESGVANVVDPLAGSWLVEELTERIKAEAKALIEEVDGRGGALAGVEQGFQQRRIHESAWRHQQAVEAEERRIVGVNHGVMEESLEPPIQGIDRTLGERQAARLAENRARRDQGAVDAHLAALRTAAEAEDLPLFEPMLEALRARATLGEVCGVLRDVWGEYMAPSGF